MYTISMSSEKAIKEMIKELDRDRDRAYEMGIEETKEVTRGSLIGIFSDEKIN